MSELHIDRLTIPVADVGPANPLPPLDPLSELHSVTLAGDHIPDEMARNVPYGRVDGILPYLLQDGYSRDRSPRDLVTAVLENDVLRATFLLEYGGRLWSLVHRPSGRELLYTNPVLQPVNLALRNAWFSGGVEWNLSTIGHHPLGFERIHAARVAGPGGEPILRMFNWERLRGTPFQIDASLPDGSSALFIHVRVRNPHDQDVPIYWWSNIAVPEREDVRVITPCDAAFRYSYDDSLTRVPIPSPASIDVSYATNGVTSNDYFFDIPRGRQPWITALDGEGRGLIQTSTQFLRGRKLFIWGMARPGRRWQEFLSEPGNPYLEIQAGIAQTQFEHVPLPAHSSFAWVEAYGLIEADPNAVHGAWKGAHAAVEAQLAKLASPETLETQLHRLNGLSDTAPGEMLFLGSGWGALEDRLRKATGAAAIASPGIPFVPESLGPEQAPWAALIDHGAMPVTDPGEAPPGYLVDESWRQVLEASPPSWLTWLHLGVMHHHAKRLVLARDAWEQSLHLTRNAWALRNLAVMDRQDGHFHLASERLLEAGELKHDVRGLSSETISVLLQARRPQEALRFIDSLGADERRRGRIAVLETRAALDAGLLDRAAAILEAGIVVPDLREGDVILEELWYSYQELRAVDDAGVPLDDALRASVRREHPVPLIYDFRMRQ